jgi:gluconate kinase
MPASLLDSQFDALESPGPDERALILPSSWSVEKLRDAVLHRARSDVAA